MNIDKFNTLTLPQQWYYTNRCGTYLASRHRKTHSVDLYEVKGYYVEIFYEHGQSECVFIRSFISEKLLAPYLEKINISALFTHS